MATAAVAGSRHLVAVSFQQVPSTPALSFVIGISVV
jgi:hypothetical protein